MKPKVPTIPGADKLFIGGRWHQPSSDQFMSVISPSDEEEVMQVAVPAIADADIAVAAARDAFDRGPWPRMSMAERAVCCERLAAELEKRLDRLNLAWMFESGAPVAHGEMINSGAGKMIWRNAIELAKSLPEEEYRSGGGVIIRREPVGTTLGVLTYNGPVVLMGMKVIPALLAGCPMIIKHAPESALTARIIAEAIEEADLPSGVASVLPAGTEVTQHLVGHAGVDMIALTGGTNIAVDVVKRSADRLARTALELGGKSPAILAEDVDFNEVAKTLIDGSTGFLGQVCVSLSRILVPRSRYDEFVELWAEKYSSLSLGPAWDTTVDRGPLAVERALLRAEKMVGQAVDEGATIAAGGKRPENLIKGWYFEPTLISDVTNRMSIAQEEVFGPVTAVIPYEGIEEAIEIANDSPFGLAASVYTQDSDLAMSVARQLRTGGVAVNLAGISLTEPFGGVKQS
ncbi:aldehyde dehydrogenase family protein, partial [Luminiphilus syltensis]|uniref:aldehyde dehydrogenase family protein n=1 Tax=Luminiphilus syltensis TaxID=1341119 RepID=UPI0005916883